MGKFIENVDSRAKMLSLLGDCKPVSLNDYAWKKDNSYYIGLTVRSPFKNKLVSE